MIYINGIDLIGHNGNAHDSKTLFGQNKEVIEHIHTPQYIHPTLASGVVLYAASTGTVLGTIGEIIPANTFNFVFDIHEILIEDVNVQDKTYELHLYYGAGDVFCGATRFASTSLKGGVPAVAMQTILIPANSRVRGRLAVDGGTGKWAKVSLRLHPY